MRINRRTLLRTGLTVASVSTAARFTVAAAPQGAADGGVSERLDRFVEQYMRDMRAPGMTLVLADRAGVQRVAAYGFEDLERRDPVRQEQLFQIGSISKSFVALCLLQLRDEGKLDLHKPVVEYLPWFRVDSTFEPITAHHLLTHGSGLPSDAKAFLSDPAARHQAAYAPGKYFHYCNLGFELLGYLAWTLDGEELPQVIRRRILEPLGMTRTEPVITLDVRARLARSYAVFQNDRPVSVSSRLCEAPGVIVTEGSGCIASTAGDMGAYLSMLANGGAGPKGRLLSKESFALFSQSHIEAKEFGPTAGYGYGIAVDTLDGHACLRHTGGMVSFASALMVDLDAGIGAFASINAMQDYRPNPVVQFAVRLLRDRRSGRPLPEIGRADPSTRIANAAELAGTYTGEGDDRLVIEHSAEALFMVRQGRRIQLEKTPEPDQFVATPPDPEQFRFPLCFRRRDPDEQTSPVTEVIWGTQWYAGPGYDGPRQFDHPPQWLSYLGHYRNESPWIGSAHIVLCRGQLWLNGVIPLQAVGDRFYLRDEQHSPEWIAFGEIVNGRCMRIKLSGEDLWRVSTA